MNIYLLLKALHIIAIIAWMAGLLYLPRIFVYHCQTSYGSESHEKFVQMEYRLLKYILRQSNFSNGHICSNQHDHSRNISGISQRRFWAE